jgi:2-polyprenyl-6-methoxyphenol hydroxylase-like FAD-dependent oxidoreductase
MANIERILIVGGGIAGLTLARAFEQSWLNVVLAGRPPELPSSSMPTACG